MQLRFEPLECPCGLLRCTTHLAPLRSACHERVCVDSTTPQHPAPHLIERGRVVVVDIVVVVVCAAIVVVRPGLQALRDLSRVLSLVSCDGGFMSRLTSGFSFPLLCPCFSAAEFLADVSLTVRIRDHPRMSNARKPKTARSDYENLVRSSRTDAGRRGGGIVMTGRVRRLTRASITSLGPSSHQPRSIQYHSMSTASWNPSVSPESPQHYTTPTTAGCFIRRRWTTWGASDCDIVRYHTE
ncbi:hypothetical protein LZ30DRAFT_449052 [Colletotrichum cereale]|nr:hypothetical protein LZ30DRAFT_449052 [Colletotrichum cereale]